MPQDIFQRQTHTHAGSFTADNVRLTAPGGLGMLAQSMSLSYQQPVNVIYELGTTNAYYVGGRPQGRSQFSRIVGPARTICGVYRRYGDICNAAGNSLELEMASTNCTTEQTASAIYVARNVVISGLTISTEANNTVITDQTQMIFTSLSCRERGAILDAA